MHLRDNVQLQNAWHFKYPARVILFNDAEHLKATFRMTPKYQPQRVHMHAMFHIQHATKSFLHDTEHSVSRGIKDLGF